MNVWLALLLNNWPTSKVIKFRAEDAVDADAARKAVKLTDMAYFRDKKVRISSVYEMVPLSR